MLLKILLKSSYNLLNLLPSQQNSFPNMKLTGLVAIIVGSTGLRTFQHLRCPDCLLTCTISLKTVQAGAVPIRVLLVTNSVSTPNVNNPAFKHLRFGHPVPYQADSVAWLPVPHAAGPAGGNRASQHHPCGGRNGFRNRIHEKTFEITNLFRGAFGWPLKEPPFHHPHHPHHPHPHPHHPHPHPHHPHPHPHHGKHNKEHPGKHHHEHDEDHHKGPEGGHAGEDHFLTLLPIVTTTAPIKPYSHGYQFHRFDHSNNFGVRLHRALMALGPWEGRALAFVLGRFSFFIFGYCFVLLIRVCCVGCGIGVLLRMFWVFAVVLVRLIRGNRAVEVHGYSPVALSTEDVMVPPPNYVFEVDMKTPIFVEDVKTPVLVEDVKTPVVAEEVKEPNEDESK